MKPPFEMSDLQITIVGLGLIGGSYAMALKELKPKKIWAIDVDTEVLRTAEEKAIIDKGYVNPDIPLSMSDIVIICLYPNLVTDFVKNNIKSFKSGAIITDATGIKESIIKEIHSFIPDDLDFIGGHPMAGNENKGLEYASEHLFNNANYIITPSSKNKEENIAILEEIVIKIGCRNIIRVSPKEHDKIIAFTSHLTHAIAVSLVNSDILDVDTKLFIGGSFRDASRVALINSELWSELMISNKDNVIKQIKVFEESISKLKNSIINNDLEFLKEQFRTASQRRRELG